MRAVCIRAGHATTNWSVYGWESANQKERKKTIHSFNPSPLWNNHSCLTAKNLLMKVFWLIRVRGWRGFNQQVELEVCSWSLEPKEHSTVSCLRFSTQFNKCQYNRHEITDLSLQHKNNWREFVSLTEAWRKQRRRAWWHSTVHS